jgi:hypothetical protein
MQQDFVHSVADLSEGRKRIDGGSNPPRACKFRSKPKGTIESKVIRTGRLKTGRWDFPPLRAGRERGRARSGRGENVPQCQGGERLLARAGGHHPAAEKSPAGQVNRPLLKLRSMPLARLVTNSSSEAGSIARRTATSSARPRAAAGSGCYTNSPRQVA